MQNKLLNQVFTIPHIATYYKLRKFLFQRIFPSNGKKGLPEPWMVTQAVLRFAFFSSDIEMALDGQTGTHNLQPQQSLGFTVCFFPGSPVMQLRMGHTFEHSPLPVHSSGLIKALGACILKSWIAPVGQTAAHTPRLSHFPWSQNGTPFFITRAPFGHFLMHNSQAMHPALQTDVTALPFSGLLQEIYVLVSNG
jgi:hypothetical protein